MMATRKYHKKDKFKRITYHEYKVNPSVKTVLFSRLRAEGNWGLFNRLRETLVGHGIPRNVAWKVAGVAFPRPETDDKPHELAGDPAYAQAQAGWANGQYPVPPEFEQRHDGTTNFSKFKEPPSTELQEAIKEVKAAPAKLEAAWDKLTREVGKRPSTSHEADLLWIVENYRVKPGDLDPAEVPSRAALSQLRHATDSVAHFGDIQKQYSDMQKQAKKGEGRGRFRDDGRSLELIEEFKKTLELEAEPDSPEGSTG